MSFNTSGINITGQFNLHSPQPLDGRYVITPAELSNFLSTKCKYPGLEFTLTESAEGYSPGVYKVMADGETITRIYDQFNRPSPELYKYELPLVTLSYDPDWSDRDNPTGADLSKHSGILIELGPCTSERMILIHILGNSYSGSVGYNYPINTCVQFYNYPDDEYDDTIKQAGAQNYGISFFQAMKVYYYEDRLYLYIENLRRPAYIAPSYYITLYSTTDADLPPTIGTFTYDTENGYLWFHNPSSTFDLTTFFNNAEEKKDIPLISSTAFNPLPNTVTSSNLISQTNNTMYYSTNCTIEYTSGTNSWYLQAPGFNASSDARLKENFRAYIPEKSILDLPIYKFDFIDGAKNQIGCKAQDLQEICPELVNTDSKGYLSIKESKLVYLLMEEVKQLKEEIKCLKGIK